MGMEVALGAVGGGGQWKAPTGQGTCHVPCVLPHGTWMAWVPPPGPLYMTSPWPSTDPQESPGRGRLDSHLTGEGHRLRFVAWPRRATAW